MARRKSDSPQKAALREMMSKLPEGKRCPHQRCYGCQFDVSAKFWGG